MSDSLVRYINEAAGTWQVLGAVMPAILVLGGLLVGLLFEWLLLRRVVRLFAGTKWYGSDLVVGTLRGVITLWLVLFGARLALLSGSFSPEVYEFVRNALEIALVFSVALVLTRLVGRSIRLYVGQVQGLPSPSLLVNVAGATIFVVAALIALQSSLDIQIGPILGALGVGGLAVALALQETLSNLFAGMSIILSRQLQPGDFVRLESGEEGYVTDINWRNTTVRALPNNMVIVPNSKLSSSVVTNYYQPEQEMSVLVPVGVAYGSDLEVVERVTIEVATGVMNEVEGGVPEFEPFIRYNNFGEFSVDFTVILRSQEAVGQYLVKHEFVKRLHERYRREGIEIPFPVRTVYARQSNGSARPPWAARQDREDREAT